MSASSISNRDEQWPWAARALMVLVIAAAVAVVWVTNQLLTERFTQDTRQEAEVRLALYSGNIQGELQRNQVVPQLLARDPTLIGALASEDYSQSSQRLISYREEIAAAGLTMLDASGRVVAATDRSRLGANFRQQPFFIEALRG
ncbi:MAG: sensor histidine kinase, partial [Pseudomonadota bacterium]